MTFVPKKGDKVPNSEKPIYLLDRGLAEKVRSVLQKCEIVFKTSRNDHTNSTEITIDESSVILLMCSILLKWLQKVRK